MTDNPYIVYGNVICDKQPIENVTVNVINRTDTSSASIQTNQDGKYQIDLTNVLDEGELAFVVVSNKSYLFRAYSDGLPKRIDIDLTDVMPTDMSSFHVTVDEI